MRRMLDRWLEAEEARLAIAYDGLKDAGPAEIGMELQDEVAVDGGLSALAEYAARHRANSVAYFSVLRAPEFHESNGIVTFGSPLSSGSPANDRVQARFYPARGKRAALLLGHWNSRYKSYERLARTLASTGIACLHLSLPYHDGRQTPGVGFAREMASENLSLTIRAHRQAVIDTRAALGWLEQRGYSRIGLVGFSLGSSIASIVAAHDSRVTALALVLMADDLAEVIWTGSATQHLRGVLEVHWTLDDLKAAWSVISPNSYAPLLATRLQRTKIIVAKMDSVFLPDLTSRYIDRLRDLGVSVEVDRIACGHYTLALFPFNLWLVFRLQRYLSDALRP